MHRLLLLFGALLAFACTSTSQDKLFSENSTGFAVSSITATQQQVFICFPKNSPPSPASVDFQSAVTITAKMTGQKIPGQLTIQLAHNIKGQPVMIGNPPAPELYIQPGSPAQSYLYCKVDPTYPGCLPIYGAQMPIGTALTANQ